MLYVLFYGYIVILHRCCWILWDEKYFKLAEMYLHDELFIALGIPVDQIKDYLFDKVRELETVKVLGYEEFETK